MKGMWWKLDRKLACNEDDIFRWKCYTPKRIKYQSDLLLPMGERNEKTPGLVNRQLKWESKGFDFSERRKCRMSDLPLSISDLSFAQLHMCSMSETLVLTDWKQGGGVLLLSLVSANAPTTSLYIVYFYPKPNRHRRRPVPFSCHPSNPDSRYVFDH